MTKKDKKVKMSVPKGIEFGTPYSMNSTHNSLYWDTERNKDPRHISFDEKLNIEVKSISDLLKEKNKAYGNTALNPTNVFSKLNSTEALCARIDDKLARIKNKGINDETEDTVDDLIGYLLLLKMSM
tara:strand:+ start:530 stop:910 length:381 start_codon:yes stop_codon:yes gene_type:complete